MKLKPSYLFFALMMSMSSMVDANAASENGKKHEEVDGGICSIPLQTTVTCLDGTTMISGMGSIAYWCDSGDIINRLSSWDEVDYWEACEGHNYLYM